MPKLGQIGKFHPIENILPRRKLVEQGLAGEVALRQHVNEQALLDGLEAVGGGGLNHHPGRPVGAGPDHAAVGGNVAGLQPVGDLRPVGGAAQIGHRDTAHRGSA
jgi:hypothetical protein